MNASTFTARVVASTGADVAASLSAAIGAMSGPLHGGAPSRVLHMVVRGRADRRPGGLRRLGAGLGRAADGLRPPGLPGRGPAGARAAPDGAGGRRTALRGRARARAGRAGRAARRAGRTGRSRPTSSSGRRSCSTSPRSRRRCSRRCSPAPGRPGGARTSSSSTASAGSSGRPRPTSGPASRSPSEVAGWAVSAA